MNQTLVSPCPNCGFDASKHNKVLYDGIFLICYNCGHGWYYNIEIFNHSKLEDFNNNPASNPINYSYNRNNLSSNNNTFKPKQKNKTLSKKTTSSNNKKHTIPTNKHYNVNSDLHYNSSQNKKNIKYYNENKYSDNIYYEPSINSKAYTKKQSYNINSINKNVSESPTFINKDNYIKIDNTLHSPLKNKTNESNYGKKTFVGNKNTQQNININKKNNLKNNKNIVIDIDNFSKINNSKSHFFSTINVNTKNISKSFKNKNNSSSKNNEISIQPIPKESIDNNYTNKKSNSFTINHSKDIVVFNEVYNGPKNTGLADLENSNTLDNKVFSKKETTFNNSLGKSLSQPLSLVNQNNNQKTHYKEYFKNNYNDLEDNLINKTNLGLANVNLLKFEEQSNYNLEQFRVPLFDIKQIISNFTDFVKEIILSLLKIPALIFTIFTRLDLFLKTLAYLFILTVSIGFLSYSYYKQHTSIRSTDLKNTDCKDETLIESNKNLIFENDNFSAINNLDSNNIVKNHSLHKESLKIAEEKPEEKTIAFEKYKGKDNLEKPEINIAESNKLNRQPIEKLSLLDTLKATINNSLFSMKKMQANAFNKIKIYNNEFSLQGEYNNTLVTCATLCNEDYKNTYLIKSLEVIFLEKCGNKIGKRIIIANQLINANSAISINLKINNPPRNTHKVVIFIKDKKQI